MLADLRDLNRWIAKHWLGELNPEQERYLAFASLCIAEFALSATELTQILARVKDDTWNRRTVAELNARYLALARAVARDTSAEGLDMLLRLGLTLRQAELLRRLPDAELDQLAFGSAGPLMRFSAQTFHRGVTLHAHAGKHHAVGLVAVQQTSEGSAK